MKLKDKIKSYSFWVSIASAVILILKVLGNRFGFVVDESMVSDIFTAICSVLVLLGIIVVPSQPNSQQNSQFNNNSLFNQSDVNKENNQVENLLNNNKLDDINEPQFSEEKELDFDDNQKVSDFSNETLQSNEDDLCKTPETTTQPDTIGGNFKKIPEENLNQAIQVTEDNNYSETPNDTTITTTQHDEQLDDNSKTTELNNLQNNPLRSEEHTSELQSQR